MLARRRTLGKNHEKYYESVQLMVLICETKSDTELAKGYKALHPAAKVTPRQLVSQGTENRRQNPSPLKRTITTAWIYKSTQLHFDKASVVAFAPDGGQVASASDDGTVTLWDVITGVALKTLKGHTGTVVAMAFGPDGSRLAAASADKTVRLWDAVTGAALKTLVDTNFVHSVAFSPDGSPPASASDDNTVRLWNGVTGAALKTLKGHTMIVHTVAFASDGKCLVSGSFDKTVRLWDVATGAAQDTRRL